MTRNNSSSLVTKDSLSILLPIAHVLLCFLTRIYNWCQRAILPLLLVIVITACTSPTPPTEFAPDGDIIQKALLFQLNTTEQRLSEQLNTSTPKIDISQIAVKTLEPVYVAELPSYHIQGYYTLTLTLPRQQVTQTKNSFEIYLQRQIEGKTWRLLRREVTASNLEGQWSSYLIQ